jgi:hypothetical protein
MNPSGMGSDCMTQWHKCHFEHKTFENQQLKVEAFSQFPLTSEKTKSSPKNPNAINLSFPLKVSQAGKTAPRGPQLGKKPLNRFSQGLS